MFRRVLLQDCAILFTKYPTLALFKYAPFTSHVFHQFSFDSLRAIQNAEVSARQNLQQLPEKMASTFRGILATNSLHQEIMQQSLQSTHAQIDSKVAVLKTIMEASLLRGSTKKKRKAVEEVLKQVSGMPLPLILLALFINDFYIVDHLSPSTDSTIDSQKRRKLQPSRSSELGSTITATAHDSAPLNQDLPLGPPVIALPLQVPEPYISLSGNIYPPSTFEFLSDHPNLREIQQTSIQKLEDLFTYERIAKHVFEWETKNEDWLPRFECFWRPKGRDLTVEDVWREDRFGIEGKFSIQELTARWGARWKRNEPRLKTEAGRRKKIIQLVEELSGKVNWTTDLALRFLHEKYPIDSKSTVAHLRTARSFMEYLNKKTKEDILEASNSYP
jgi:hypothetical protein